MVIDPIIINNEEKQIEELKRLMMQNLALTAEIKEITHSIKSYITFQKFISIFYFLLIVVPIILSVIYLPPLLKNMMGQYNDVLGGSSTAGIENLLKNMPQQIQQ